MQNFAVVVDDKRVSEQDTNNSTVQPELEQRNSNVYQELEVAVSDLSTSESVSETDNRETWGSRLEFLLSCLSYAIGLSNVWRFPYVCYKNGGGAFLLPFMITLFVAGLPLVFLEMAFGQFASEGVITIWKILPIFKGLGWAMCIVSGLLCIYYNVIIAWTVYYFFASFSAELPWSKCGSWSSPMCVAKIGGLINCSHLDVGNDASCMPMNSAGQQQNDPAHNISKDKKHFRTSSDEYFHRKVLNISDGLSNMGEIQWDLALYLLLCWIFVYLCLAKGLKTTGKAVYFTALFPYLILSILFIQGLTLDGSTEGIKYFITPQWDKLTSAAVWSDAAVQVFFSLSPGMGGLITLASYNKFHNSCLIDAIIVSVVNFLTSVFSGLVIFTIIGYMAHELGQSVANVAQDGAGLAFVVYPEAFTTLSWSQFWSLLFFSMLFSLGLGSQIVNVMTVHSTLLDTFPKIFRKNRRNAALLLLALSLFFYIAGLLFCTRGGMYLLQLFDNYAATHAVLIIVIIESMAISWVYGADRFMDDIMCMLGKRPNNVWKIMWMYVCPGILMVILIFTCANWRSSTYGDVIFPLWADVIGVLMEIASLIVIPIVAAYVVFKIRRELNINVKTAIQLASQPTDDWGPRLPEHRRLRAKLSPDYI